MKHSKPTKWATVLKTAAHFVGLMAFQTLPGVSPSASPQALLRRPLRGLKKRTSKTRSKLDFIHSRRITHGVS